MNALGAAGWNQDDDTAAVEDTSSTSNTFYAAAVALADTEAGERGRRGERGGGEGVIKSLVGHRAAALRKEAAEGASLIDADPAATVEGDLTTWPGTQRRRRRIQEVGGDAETLAAAASILQEFHESAALTVHELWWDFFFTLAGTFRDLYKVVDVHTENFNLAYRYLTVPR